MSESEPSPTQDIDDLAARVDELLEQMQSACEEVASRFSETEEEVDADLAALLAETEELAPPVEPELIQPSPSEPDQAIAEEAIAEEPIAEEPAIEAQAVAEPTGEIAQAKPPAVEQDDGLGDELDALLRESEGTPDPSPLEAETDIGSIEELDERLAQATAAMLDDSSSPPAAAERPAAQAQAEATQATQTQTKPEQTKPEQIKPEQTKPEQTRPEQTRPEQTRPEQPRPAQANAETAKPDRAASGAAAGGSASSTPIPDGRLAPVIAFARVAARHTARTARVAAVRAEPTAKAAATALAKPLDAQPPVVRQTIGWVGLWTIFLAACVWLTLAMFRTAPTPPPAAQPNSLSEMPAPRSG